MSTISRMPDAVALELMRYEMRWGEAIEQGVLINSKFDDLIVRFNRAVLADQQSQLRSLCLQIAKYDDVHHMYEIYADRMVVKMVAIHDRYEEDVA